MSNNEFTIIESREAAVHKWMYGKFKDDMTEEWMSVNADMMAELAYPVWEKFKGFQDIEACSSSLLEMRGQIYGVKGGRPRINGIIVTDEEYRIYQTLLDYSHSGDCSLDNICNALEAIGAKTYTVVNNRDMSITIRLDEKEIEKSSRILFGTDALPIAQGVELKLIAVSVAHSAMAMEDR
ncbi:MAG: hypothetical protein QS748_14825 [Candidatus Endonucleobacter bathymodioli]|uniref:Uncharacterized protein n=1 Tax=Candidatus Endonucleibacter bathymodioli TaxID=539814 RepID=A0AA90SNR0_9GAMM|nr:hypothetical protein [Candidatus Endonucleobacter bathymodioli]